MNDRQVKDKIASELAAFTRAYAEDVLSMLEINLREYKDVITDETKKDIETQRKQIELQMEMLSRAESRRDKESEV